MSVCRDALRGSDQAKVEEYPAVVLPEVVNVPIGNLTVVDLEAPNCLGRATAGESVFIG